MAATVRERAAPTNIVAANEVLNNAQKLYCENRLKEAQHRYVYFLQFRRPYIKFSFQCGNRVERYVQNVSIMRMRQNCNFQVKYCCTKTVISNQTFATFATTTTTIGEDVSEAPKKPKSQPIPKITLISGNDISVTTLEEAQKISKRRDLKLVKVTDLDTKSNRPIYKLMTNIEYHAEDLKQRDLKKKQKQNASIKGEKVLLLGSAISAHDLETKTKQIEKWLKKQFEVKIAISGDMQKAEDVFKYFQEHLKDARFLQKRTKGSDLKFQIVPPKPPKENSEDL